MKVAIIHEWLVTAAGSERVLEQIISLFPHADIYSLVDFLPARERSIILDKKVTTSFIQSLPFARKYYRNYRPLVPLAVEGFNLSQYDLILSSSHAVAKGVKKDPGQLHICYCHTPMRYAWDLRDQYLKESGLDHGLKGLLAKMTLEYLRRWDARTADRVDYFIANSRYIGDRIKRSYNRDASVIYPPVDVNTFVCSEVKDDYYFTASRMVPYKKVDLIVEAFSTMPDKKLVVVGDGPDFGKVKTKAAKNIEFLGYQPSDVLKGYMQRAKAFVFAAEEDFGIVPVEAQACGTPVIAFGRGGVLETIQSLGEENRSEKPPTGIFFKEQTPQALCDAVLLFEKNIEKFNGQKIRENAIRFSRERFRMEFMEFVNAKVVEWRERSSSAHR
jgi:glycosyltransferase involved in cell wall biosynthesis